MSTVYVLVSQSTGKLYIGQTENLSRRLTERQADTAGYARGRGPWEFLLTDHYLQEPRHWTRTDDGAICSPWMSDSGSAPRAILLRDMLLENVVRQ